MKKKRKQEPPPKKRSVKGYIIGLLACIPFLLFGAVMIGLSVTEIFYTSACTAETVGTVGDVSVKSEYRRDSKGRRYTLYTYTAQYSYELNGEQITDTIVTSNMLKKGQTVRIRYVPDDPGQKYVKGYDDAGNLLPMIFGIVWCAFILVIMYGIISSLRHKLSEIKALQDNSLSK